MRQHGSQESIPYVGRFAPSPTGPLHLGSLYAALASYLQAKSNNGLWLLRIDDVDSHRSVPGAIDQILTALEALGLAWDGPVVFQSQRRSDYQAAMERLWSSGAVYRCVCSRKELAEEDGALRAYPGTCRHRLALESPRDAAVRLVTDDRPITFEDRLHGRQVQNLSQTTGDFVVFRRDLIYAYHLATVVDDAQQGVTEVVRGTDLLDSTPRQIYLQQCLGFPTPSYMHTPVLLAENGRKLSKQTLAQPADIRSPGRLLSDLLDLLRQNPPPSLKSANPQDVLAWAVDHWKPGALRGITAIPLVAGRAAGPE